MRLGVCQTRATLGNKAKNIAAIREAAHVAAAWKADLLLMPELFLTGYNIGDSVDDLAEATTGPSLKSVAEIAHEAVCAICVGFPERHGEAVFNSSALFDASGNLAALYRKIHLFGPTEKKLFTPGDKLVVARLAGRTIGMAICYDIEFPEFTRELRRRGADVVIVPTANMTPYFEVPTTFIRARSLESGIFVAYANHCGTEGDLEYTGLSGVTGPDGRDLARAGIQAEALLLVELPGDYPSNVLSTQLDDLQLPTPE